MDKYDAIVVGAGTAGCLAAKTIAEKGLKVCIVEKKPKTEIGEKICGDALGEHHLKFLGLEKPTGGELEAKIDGIKIYSPDENTVFTIADKDFVGYLLNRHLFGQWLLKKATDSGALLQDNMNFRSPIIEKGAVVGISAKNMKTGKVAELRSKVVVDATGYFGMVRKQLPAEMGIDREIDNADVEACYREIRQLKQETENTRFCEIYLNQKASPGGYVWIFPKGGARVNVGIGACMRKTGYPNPKEQLYATAFKKPMFDGSLVLTGGAWFDPVRRPIDNMVGNGVMLVGDAASLVNPIHGGGIGPSMLSGYFAGQQIVEALCKGRTHQRSTLGLQQEIHRHLRQKTGHTRHLQNIPTIMQRRRPQLWHEPETHDRRRRTKSRHGRRLPPKHHRNRQTCLPRHTQSRLPQQATLNRHHDEGTKRTLQHLPKHTRRLRSMACRNSAVD